MKILERILSVMLLVLLSACTLFSRNQISGTMPDSTSGDSLWHAKWIWQNVDGPGNTWLCARKTFTLGSTPEFAPTRIAAENKYWLYVNDSLVVRDGGLDLHPDLENTYYDSVDIARWLRKGENVVAVLVWYKGGHDGYSQRLASKGGILFETNVPVIAGERIVSDSTWKVRIHPSFMRTAQEQQWKDWKWIEYPVIYDARNDPGSWTSLAYDDAAWARASVKGSAGEAPWHALVSRTIPMLKVSGLKPFKNSAQLPAFVGKDTSFTADVGENIQGYAYLKIEAHAGDTIRIRMNEWYTEQYIAREGVQEYVTYQWQNPSGQPWLQHCVEFAFSGIREPVHILSLEFKPSGYNTEMTGAFSCDDARLNRLWNKCRNTSYVCMRDQFYDCPDRERGQWWGDVSEQILYSFYLYDSRASLLAKKGFRELMNTQKADGSLYSTAPGVRFHLPDQNLAAVMSVGDYLMYTGDSALVRELYPKISNYIERYVAPSRNADGMLLLRDSVWNWIDWGESLDVQTGSANTVVNGVFIRLMETLKLLANASGNARDTSAYAGMEAQTRQHFNDYFWNADAHAYVFHKLNGVQSRTMDDRSNAWAVLAGAADSFQRPGVLRVLKTQLDASPYQERYIEDAMFAMGKDSEALGRMEEYYRPDIDSWSQTMWERMGKTSTNNHAWAASPCYLLGAKVAGIQPTSPGFATYQVLPMMGPLRALSATVPTVKGTITTTDSVFADSFKMNLRSPEGTRALVGIPRKNEWSTVSVNGKKIWERGKVLNNVAGLSSDGMDARYIKFVVGPGVWEFVAVTRK